MFDRVEHPHVVSSHPGRDLDGKNVVVIFTDLPVDSNHSGFDELQFESLRIAVGDYLNSHPEYERATIVSR